MKQLDNIVNVRHYLEHHTHLNIKQQLPNYIIKGIWYQLTVQDEDVIIKRKIEDNLTERFMYESSFFHNDHYL